jgi:hypothetical protein
MLPFSTMEIGVAPGVRITFNADHEPLCRGATIEEALAFAEEKAQSATGERQLFLLKWIEAAKKRIEVDDLDALVDRKYKKEYASVEKHAKTLPAFARKPVEDFMRERIRKELKTKDA